MITPKFYQLISSAEGSNFTNSISLMGPSTEIMGTATEFIEPSMEVLLSKLKVSIPKMISKNVNTCANIGSTYFVSLTGGKVLIRVKKTIDSFAKEKWSSKSFYLNAGSTICSTGSLLCQFGLFLPKSYSIPLYLGSVGFSLISDHLEEKISSESFFY